MEKLRIAVVGAGFIGELHARILYEYPLAELVSVVDIREETAKAVADRYGCSYYSDMKQMLEKEDTDAVDICTPEDYHLEPVRLAAEHKKHILLEKPVAKTTQEADEIKRLADTHHVRLMIGHILHFDPRYVSLLESIQKGQLGDIVSMFFRRANWKRTSRRLMGKVSFLYYMSVHDIEFMLSCNCQTRPIKVYAQGVSSINREIGQQDTAFLTITFENGSVACIQVMWAMPENTTAILQTGAEVLGTKGIGFIDGKNQGVEIITDQSSQHPDILHWPQYNGQMQGDLKEELQHFVRATLYDEAYFVNTDHAIMAVSIIEAAFKSMETGAAVML